MTKTLEIWWNEEYVQFTDKVKKELRIAALKRIGEVSDCIEGELCQMVKMDGKEFEARGWWKFL